MRIAVVGSRRYPDLEAVKRFVYSLPADTVIVTGGASGVDGEAEVAGAMMGFGLAVFYPDYDRFGRRAPLIRNKQIAESCDRMVAFWDGKSTGTAHVTAEARKLGKPVEIHTPGPRRI